MPARTLGRHGIGRCAATALTGIVVLAGCSSTSTPSGSASSTATRGAPRPSDRLYNDNTAVGIGATFQIAFGDGGADGVLHTTLTKFVDRALGSPPAAAGTRYAAYAFSIVDETQATTAPAFPILGSLTAYGYKGGSYPAVAGVRLDTGTMLAGGSIVLATNVTVAGWVVFAIPTDDVATLVRLAPSGPSGNQATWDVRPPTPASTASPAASPTRSTTSTPPPG